LMRRDFDESRRFFVRLMRRDLGAMASMTLTCLLSKIADLH